MNMRKSVFTLGHKLKWSAVSVTGSFGPVKNIAFWQKLNSMLDTLQRVPGQNYSCTKQTPKMKMAEQDVAPCEDQRLGIGQSNVNIS
jgi:hypothetical protein